MRWASLHSCFNFSSSNDIKKIWSILGFFLALERSNTACGISNDEKQGIGDPRSARSHSHPALSRRTIFYRFLSMYVYIYTPVCARARRVHGGRGRLVGVLPAPLAAHWELQSPALAFPGRRRGPGATQGLGRRSPRRAPGPGGTPPGFWGERGRVLPCLGERGGGGRLGSQAGEIVQMFSLSTSPPLLIST